MVIYCTGCNAKLKTPEMVAGKRIKCPKCATIIDLPPLPVSEPTLSQSDESTAKVTSTPNEDSPNARNSDGDGEWEDEEVDESESQETSSSADGAPVRTKRKRKKIAKTDAEELRLLGRRALCKKIGDIASFMQRIVKNRVLKDNPYAKKMEDDELTNLLKTEADKFANRDRVLAARNAPDEDFDRGQLKAIMLSILLQEETYGCEEKRLDEKVLEFEKNLVKKAKALDWEELKRSDPDRWHHLDTYRIVLDAAWGDDNLVSPDESRLLAVLRNHLAISLEEHWLISAFIKKFPKEKRAEHTPDEIDEARKQMHRDGLLWSYCDENDRKVDSIPAEIAEVLRVDAGLELQRSNYQRLLNHDGVMLADLRNVLQKHGLNRYGNKADLIERIVASNIKPTEVLGELEKDKLSSMCAFFGLKAYGNKPDFIQSLTDFYDDLTFVERTTKDDREVWYNNYELLACRSYAELRAKKIISKDLDIERMFEKATEFLFTARLHVPCERATKDNRSDGRLPLDGNQSILWDCKSVETIVNLQDHLDFQFDSYLRKDREGGNIPLAFLVIAPGFTPQSIKLAIQYKSKTNWDIALITAEGLKHLAERWHAIEPEKPFPVRLLNQTAVVLDKERAEYLLSLA